MKHAQTAEHTDPGRMYVTGAKGKMHQTVFSILFVKRLSTVTKQTHVFCKWTLAREYQWRI